MSDFLTQIASGMVVALLSTLCILIWNFLNAIQNFMKETKEKNNEQDERLDTVDLKLTEQALLLSHHRVRK